MVGVAEEVSGPAPGLPQLIDDDDDDDDDA